MPLSLSPSIFRRFQETFLGDKKFYRIVLTLILPIIAQNMVTNLVNLLDNVMVGGLGTTHMSGVAIANQLVFVFNLAVFGAVSGAGVYGAQFYGARDWEGLKEAFRFKLLAAAGITAIAVAVLLLWDVPLISLFLTGEGNASDAASMLLYGRQFLRITLLSLLPAALSQCYSSTLREAGKAVLPMVSSIAAVLVSLVFNYVLIYGKLGFPALGVRGSAIATLLSRLVELGILVGFTHTNPKKYFFLKGVYRSFRIRLSLAKSIAAKSLPLLANELLWSVGTTTLTLIFSTRGLMVVAGLNIASTVTNLFNVFFISMGTAVAVMTGQALGANNIDLARKQVWKFLFFSVCTCLVLGSALAISAEYIPNIYNTEEEVRRLATVFMRTSAMYMAFNAISHGCYFVLRSGGKTLVTMLFDSVYSWAVVVPYTFLMVNYTGLKVELLYPLCNLTEVLKCIVGVAVVRTGYWAKNMVGR